MEERLAAEVLRNLSCLTSRVAGDVLSHSRQVAEVSARLANNKSGTSVIKDAVRRLLKANQQVQEKLSQTEDQLRCQVVKLEAQAAAARTDPLTLLGNRRALEEELHRSMSEFRDQGRCFSLVTVDLDHFKELNDTHGHAAGDEVLRGLAKVLRHSVTENAFVARLGGEEFTILIQNAPLDEACAAADVAREAVKTSCFPYNGDNLSITASFGVAGRDVNGPATAEELLRHSEEALDLAKASGGDCVVRHGEFDDQDEAWSTFAAPGKLFEAASARDVMTPLPCTLRSEELASDAAALLRHSRLAALAVVDDEGKLLGVVTEGCLGQDLASRKTATATVGQVMKREATCLDEKASFNQLVESFAQDPTTPVVIAHDGRPTGLAVPENLVLLGRKLSKESLAATVPSSPRSDYLVVPDRSPAEITCEAGNRSW